MIRIGIIGAENSHAAAFTEIFNQKAVYEDMRVVAVWGDEEDAVKTLSDKFNVPAVKPADMLPMVDVVMVTSRNGRLHPGYARPFIEAGKPAFVDKPIANDAKEAADLINFAFDKGVPVMGGSSLKEIDDTMALKAVADTAKAENKLLGGFVYAPINMDNPYGGFYFYSSHLIEIAMTIFGYDPVAVSAHRHDKGVSVILEYRDFAITLGYTSGAYNYGGTVLTTDGATSRPINMGDAYDKEVNSFVKMVRTGETPQGAHDIIMPIRVLNAIEKAYLTETRCVIE